MQAQVQPNPSTPSPLLSTPLHFTPLHFQDLPHLHVVCNHLRAVLSILPCHMLRPGLLAPVGAQLMGHAEFKDCMYGSSMELLFLCKQMHLSDQLIYQQLCLAVACRRLTGHSTLEADLPNNPVYIALHVAAKVLTSLVSMPWMTRGSLDRRGGEHSARGRPAAQQARWICCLGGSCRSPAWPH